MITVKNFLYDLAIKDGATESNVDDEALEILFNSKQVNQERLEDDGFGVVELECIVKIGDVFIKYTDYEIHGGASMYEKGLSYDWKKMSFVSEKKRVVVEIYYE